MAAAAAAAGACASLTVYEDLNEAGPSEAGTSSSTTHSVEKQSSVEGNNGAKKTHRVTIKDTNPTYHRGMSSSTKDVIISVREKHGSFRAAVPCMPTPVAVVCCLLNLVAPGTGTLVSAFACLCCGYPEVRPVVAFFWNLLAAFLQMLTFVFIVGWIWSIIWGMTFISLASEYTYIRQIRISKHHAAVLRSDSSRSS
ncbi:protein stum homolog [Diadema setosum]|uniref:protein stum homolog n=1 Tax=Diadema setosum TaxID=31175 RepID=UPI003B3BA79B